MIQISKTVTARSAADMLLEHDHIVILSHRKPDGDTIGSAFALLFALENAGKTARVECEDGYPPHFGYIFGDYTPKEFEPDLIAAVDVASLKLLGCLRERYPRVHLCIDHHISNEGYADHLLLDADAAAAVQIVWQVILEMGQRPGKAIANALFTGLTTDTGCFKYANTTPATHRLAAELIDCGAEHHAINKRMFDTKSRGRLEVERMMYENFDFRFDGRCVFSFLPADIMDRLNLTEEDVDGLSSLGRQIEGVLASVMLRANPDGSFRVSMRSEDPVNASAICTGFGGGGHKRAAGCTMRGSFDEVKARLLEAVGKELPAR